MPLCRHGSEEVELTAWPAPWLKTIKSKVEIGRSLAVTYNSGTDVRDCKFPLAATPCRQTRGQMVACGCARARMTHKYCMHSRFSFMAKAPRTFRNKKAEPVLYWKFALKYILSKHVTGFRFVSSASHQYTVKHRGDDAHQHPTSPHRRHTTKRLK